MIWMLSREDDDGDGDAPEREAKRQHVRTRLMANLRLI